MTTDPYDLITNAMSDEEKAKIFLDFFKEEMKKNNEPILKKWEESENAIIYGFKKLLFDEYLRYRDKGY